MKRIFILLLLLVYPAFSYALPESVIAVYPTLQKVGEGKYSVFFMKVYKISYYQSKVKPYLQALHINYYMDLKAEKRLNRAVDDIKSQHIPNANIEEWTKEMAAIFPDVKDGDTITIIQTQDESSKFYHNNEFKGEIKDPLYTKAFFNIWLGEGTNMQHLRSQLLEKAFHK